MLIPQINTTTDGIENRTDLISYDLTKHRIIYLNGDINNECAISICTQLRYLSNKSNKNIYLFINSPGGSVSDGLMIYDYINEIPCDVVTIANGIAASMGSFLLSSGTRGKRYATPCSEIMIHQPLGGVQGQASDISIVCNHIQQVKNRLASLMAKNCSKKSSEIIKDMERDYWMTASEALDYGIIDCIGFPEII